MKGYFMKKINFLGLVELHWDIFCIIIKIEWYFKLLAKIIGRDTVDSGAFAPFIFTKYLSDYDPGLIAHEKTHIKQAYRSCYLFYPKYLFSKKYRLKVEIEAYGRQMLYSNDIIKSAGIFSILLSNNYGNIVSQPDAQRMLLENYYEKTLRNF